jgi:hypothetical protein
MYSLIIAPRSNITSNSTGLCIIPDFGGQGWDFFTRTSIIFGMSQLCTLLTLLYPYIKILTTIFPVITCLFVYHPESGRYTVFGDLPLALHSSRITESFSPGF